MTQALNFTTKAIECLEGINSPHPGVQQGFRYIAEKLREAQVFVLPDYGTLLDRSKAPVELPGEMYHPPFPVVALEYTARGDRGRWNGQYTALKSSRRIALAFDWQNDLPPIARMMAPQQATPGFVVMSIFYNDEDQMWIPVSAGIRFDYDQMNFRNDLPSFPFRDAMIASGRMNKAAVKSGAPAGTLVPILPEAIILAGQVHGVPVTMDAISADLMDEVNAYFDLCAALGCRNVQSDRHAPPDKLNRQRMKAGKPLLSDFLTLSLDGDQGGGGTFEAAGSRRSHLRRGHIRRLSADRITWVNQTMVTGQGGFKSKSYVMKGAGQ
ncbi:hypothetical protein H5J25_13740 [Sphingomonas aliaeris]|uniref:Uncharacterized protein n=1 Tax=Sphingomonas aliaeris TaxID=2759526 RepID=A0A974NTH4_9SPHN|nr:hypothetical protein [Sphingomonas aliaeris]QQV76507.1 hypothetical protein H5J25_13740 [Sphingomonas aliaeris]